MIHPIHYEWRRASQLPPHAPNAPAAESETSERVLGALEEALARGTGASPLLLVCTARGLGMSARTLQRRLNASRTCYSALVRCKREFRAVHLLSQSELSLQEIAEAVGFSELSAFSRAFKRWTGTPPSRFRRARAPSGRLCPDSATAPAHQPG